MRLYQRNHANAFDLAAKSIWKDSIHSPYTIGLVGLCHYNSTVFEARHYFLKNYASAITFWHLFEICHCALFWCIYEIFWTKIPSSSTSRPYLAWEEASIGHRPELPSQTLIPARVLRKLHRALLSPARLDDRRSPEVARRNLPEHVLG